MKIKSLFALAGLSLFAASAFAHGGLSGIDQRQFRQEQRIEHGVRTGQLTQREATRLYRQQEKIERLEYLARADGVVTPRERERLQSALERQNQHIRHAMSNQRHDFNHNARPDRRYYGMR